MSHDTSNEPTVNAFGDPRSWHKSAGWEDQLQRVERWYERARAATSEGLSSGISEHGWDDIYAFFINAYHVGDWLIADDVIEKPRWDSFVESSPDLSLCRDLCNGAKHRRLRKHSTVDLSPWTRREFVPPKGERWSVCVYPARELRLLDDVLGQVLQQLQLIRNSGLPFTR